MNIRLGLHRNAGRADHDFRRYVAAVRPNVVKMLDDTDNGLIDFCRQNGTDVILRNYIQDQKLGAEGHRQMREVVAHARQHPGAKWIELHNEAWQNGEEMSRYADLSIEFMQALDALGTGQKAVIGCFSTGQPETHDWVRFLPALQHAALRGHAVGLHEYGGGPVGMKWGVGANQHPWNGRVDECERPGLEGWWCFRYRKAVAEWRRLGMATIPGILITEGGIDDIWPRPGHAGKGYKDYIGEHPPGVGDYAHQWAWYCRHASEDAYMLGAVDFGYGSADPQWDSFDMSTDTATLDRMIAEMRALPAAGPGSGTGGTPVADPMLDILNRRFGNKLRDVRATLPSNPHGPSGPFGPMGTVDGIAVHHTASPYTTTWASIANYHITGRQFAGIGYHLGLQDGLVWYLGDVRTARAHVTNQNHRLIGTVWAGNYQNDTPRDDDSQNFYELVAGIDEYLGRQVPVQGHGTWHVNHTVCPGRGLGAVVANARGQAGGQLEIALLKWADEAQAKGIQPNVSAALYRQARTDGFFPLTDESGARGEVPTVEGFPVVAQLFRQWEGTEERVYSWHNGAVKWVKRP